MIILFYAGLIDKFKNYETSVKLILDNSAQIYTTNFDRLCDGLRPQHLHGSFIKDYIKYDEIVLTYINENDFYLKCLWGWNGYGKLNFIEQIKKISGYERYFDFNFFFGDIYISNLLIYGIAFQRAGYIKELSEYKPRYKNPVIGGVIDEHILLRLESLQEKGILHNITFAYYSNDDLENYKQLCTLFNFNNVNFIKSSSFSFNI